MIVSRKILNKAIVLLFIFIYTINISAKSEPNHMEISKNKITYNKNLIAKSNYIGNPKTGLWYNPSRSGHGLNIEMAGSSLIVVWYTYLADGSPTWYLASNLYDNSGSWIGDLKQYTWNSLTHTANGVSVGTIWLNFTDDNNTSFSWQLGNQTGEELFTLLIGGAATPSSIDYTGLWYPPSDSGWGLTSVTSGNTEVVVLYFYDTEGHAVWGLGVNNESIEPILSLDVYSGFCPNCPTISTIKQTLGSIAKVFDSQTTGTLTMNINNSVQMSGWTRNIDWHIDNIQIGMLSNPSSRVSRFNDSGVTIAGNHVSGNSTICTNDIILQQDCNVGRDATDNDNSDGHAGFSFTKLDMSGIPLNDQSVDYDVTPWTCVRDNVTGLVWEVKTDYDDGGSFVHLKYEKYQWGGLTAIGRDHPGRKGNYYDDWNELIEDSNNNNFCGYNDWRVPTIDELTDLVDYSNVDRAIDTDYFPNTSKPLPNTNSLLSTYWTSSPTVGRADLASWLVNYSTGFAQWEIRDYNNHVRLVRSN